MVLEVYSIGIVFVSSRPHLSRIVLSNIRSDNRDLFIVSSDISSSCHCLFKNTIHLSSFSPVCFSTVKYPMWSVNHLYSLDTDIVCIISVYTFEYTFCRLVASLFKPPLRDLILLDYYYNPLTSVLLIWPYLFTCFSANSNSIMSQRSVVVVSLLRELLYYSRAGYLPTICFKGCSVDA